MYRYCKYQLIAYSAQARLQYFCHWQIFLKIGQTIVEKFYFLKYIVCKFQLHRKQFIDVMPINFLLKAHCHAFVTKLFVETVVKSRMDSKVQSALTSLCKLYAVHGIVENLGGFIQVC